MSEISGEHTPEETSYLAKLHNGARLQVTKRVMINVPRPQPFEGTTPLFLQNGDYLAVIDHYTRTTAPNERTPLGWTVRIYREDDKPRSTQAVDMSFNTLIAIMGSVSVVPARDKNIVHLGENQ